MAEIPRKSPRDFARPSLARLCKGRTTGVRPRGTKLRPRTSSERGQVSSPQERSSASSENTVPLSHLARATMAGYSRLSQRCTASADCS